MDYDEQALCPYCSEIIVVPFSVGSGFDDEGKLVTGKCASCGEVVTMNVRPYAAFMVEQAYDDLLPEGYVPDEIVEFKKWVPAKVAS
jgi:hypothetical protein